LAYESAVNRRPNPHANMAMKQMVKSHLGPVAHGSSSYEQPSTLSPVESQRNYKIASWLNAKNFMGNIYTRFVFPGDESNSHTGRANEFFRQSAMPWGSNFMHTPTDAQRLNNPAMSSFTKIPQKTIPDTYGQFYAFMHAMSAAFGNLQSVK
jgi:hypothetical protein